MRGPRLLALLALLAAAGAQLNRAPHFSPGGDMARWALREDAAVGAPVYRLLGLDPEGGRVHYSVSGDWLSVDRDSGVVSLRRQLDREADDLLEVIISITDEGLAGAEPNTVSLRREVPVLDVNDNPPVFQGRPYSFSVAETAAVGQALFSNITVTDRDGGVNADIAVSCEPADGAADAACDTFGVAAEKVAEGEFRVSLSLLRPLDYEAQAAYSVQLRAEDRAAEPAARLLATARVAVRVQDVQDQRPVFLNAPYSASVAEGAPPGTVVLRVRARDGDAGSPRPVRLSLEGEHLGCFRLRPPGAPAPDPAVAEAELATSDRPLDREHADILLSGGIYSFGIRATELINNEVPGDSALSQVTIIVTDVDDQLPAFNQRHFHINVSEDIGADTPLPGLNMVAHDRDVGENARFGLRVLGEGPAAGLFSVQPAAAAGRAPLVLKLAPGASLDYDVEDPALRRLQLRVVATVAGPQGEEVAADEARVTIDLQDANDHAPEFPQQQFRVRVRENAAPGSALGALAAADRDSGLFGRVRYSLRGFGAEQFATDPALGGLFLANGSRGLDYESRPSYSLSAEARDGGGRVSVAALRVEVLDVNDNAPVFEQREYQRLVREGATSFEPQLFVRATDADGPEQGGGKVFYSIVSANHEGALFVEPVSGEVKLNSAARAGDTARGQYELEVRATDAGSPPLWSETRVLVRVGVPGNQRPVFRGSHTLANAPPRFSASVAENAPAGTEVLQLAASDPDGQDSLLSFAIAGGASDNFAINSTSGLISVAPEAALDLQSGPRQYRVIVHAVDAGAPLRETATATVLVSVTDVNNKPPAFSAADPAAYVQHISEATPVGSVVMNVTAVDPDSDAKLEYSIVEPIRAADNTGVALKSTVPFDFKNAFRINSLSGQLLVAKQLDHTAAAVIVLTVKAQDLNTVEGEVSATVEVTLHVQASDNNTPVFTVGGWSPARPLMRVAVPEERPIGTTVFTLAAIDPITGLPVTHFLQDVSPGSRGYEFASVNIQSGDIMLKKVLDYENLQNKSIILKVQAIAFDRISESMLIIDVEDINDNSPEFPQEMYTAHVPESTRHPKPILTVQATDKDFNTNETGYGAVRYSLAGDNARLFVINSTSGVVSVAPNATLDHEQYSTLRFSVVAYDMPQGGANQRKSSASVIVEILDVNDNAPSFAKSSYSAVVPENVPVGTAVLTISATDPDTGLGGEIAYELLDEGEANGLFAVNYSVGRITTKHALTGKGRSEPYNLVMRAQDSGDPQLYSDALLSIYIGDVFSNDGVPTFIRPTLNDIARISENSSIGSPVFQVVATDPDDPTTPNGKLHYKFLDDGHNAHAFRIDSESGLISTRKLLDREQRENYTLVIAVQDEGSPPQQATHLLPVRVLDVDDHSPLFQRGLDDEPVSMIVQEEVPDGTEIGSIEAIDQDIGENGMIDYLIIYGNENGVFNISRTEENKGLITAVKRLDREDAADHLLTVKCFKRSLKPPSLRKTYNRQDPSEIQVLIKVEDIDDNKPKFLEDNITIGVRLNVPADTALLTLETIDDDALPAPVSYGLVNTTFFSLAASVMDTVSVPTDHNGTFRLNSQTGELRTTGSMLPYADGFFELQVIANNTDNPGMEAYAIVKVFVLRDRDLLKFVFNKPPSDVRRELAQFQREVEQALLLPVTLNVYDTQFYAKEDGSLDFSSTSSCFQLVGRESYDLGDMESLMKDLNNAELDRVYKKYGVQEVHHCALRIARAEATWIQLWVLSIAAFIGISAFVAGITICCLYSRYKKVMRRALLQEMPTMSNMSYLTRANGSPPIIITSPSAISDSPRIYDGLTLSTSHDNMSYHSFPAR